MFVSVLQNNKEYYFQVGDNECDHAGSYLSSLDDHHLIINLPQKYASFGEAHLYGRIVTEQNPACVLSKKLSFYKHSFDEFDKAIKGVSLQDQIVEHFTNQESLITKRLDEVLRGNDLDDEESQRELEAVDNEIGIVLNDISKSVDEFDFTDDDTEIMANIHHYLEKLKGTITSKQTRTSQSSDAHLYKNASKKHITIDVKNVLMDFGKSAILTLNNKHPNIYMSNIVKDCDLNNYFLTLSEQNDDSTEPVLDLCFNDRLLLIDILPRNCNHQLYSKEFFDEYWLPVVWSIGHVFIPEHNTLAHAKCITRHNNTIEMDGIDVNSQDRKVVTISFHEKIGQSNQSWWMKVSQKQSNGNITDTAFKDDFIGREVKCIDPSLPSYFNRTGSIISVDIGADTAEITVDFRRGLGHITLRDDQLEFFALG